MSLAVGIDIGSSGVKLALLDPVRGMIASADAPVPLTSLRPGFAEADPNEWVQAVRARTPELLARGGVDAAAVSGISVTGMVPAVVVTGHDGEALRPAILQSDARAHVEIEVVRERLADLDLLSLSGSPLTQQSVAPTLLWLRSHERDVVARAAHVVGSYDWFAMHLGAEPHVERNWALESGLFKLDGTILERVFDAAEASTGLIPEQRDPGAPVGALSATAASETSLREGTPIYVGGADHVASAFAAGLLRPGEILIKLGTAGDVLVVAESPLLDPRLYLDRHMVPGLWMPNGCMATSGSLLRWFQTSITGGASFEQIDAEATAAGAGAHGLVCLPYLLGEKSPLHDPSARGAFLGLHLGHNRGDLYRACLEGTAFGFRQHLDAFRDHGITPTTVRVTNGGARSTAWKQVIADVCGIPLHPVRDHPGGSLGAALAASIGAGELPDWSAGERLIRLGRAIEPHDDDRATLDELYDIYVEAATTLAPLSHRLADISRASSEGAV